MRRGEVMECHICNDVAIQPGPGPGSDSDPESKSISWHSLQKTALLGCISCKIIESTVLTGSQDSDRITSIEASSEDGSLAIEVGSLRSNYSTPVHEKLYPFAVLPTPWDTIPFGPFSSFVAADMAFAIAKIQDWMKTCTENHTCFGEKVGVLRKLPTRVLHVGDERTLPRLHVPAAGKEGLYAALSYRWGSPGDDFDPLLATQSNIDTLQAGIEFTKLPKTFRDAVEICRALGVDYLWIDSLCILQDSEQDWHRESSRMGKIYKGAYVTFAADHSPHPGIGLFRPAQRAPPKLREFVLIDSKGKTHTIRVQSEWPKPSEARSYRVDNSRACYASDASSELLKRGWVLQERLLSNRIVHFTETELTWECRELYECSCGNPVGRKSPKASFERMLSLAIGSRNYAEDGVDASLFQMAPLWHHIVRSYTPCKLTFIKDRLPALSGIAQEIPWPAEEYCAGLWRRTIQYDLLWRNPLGDKHWDKAQRKRRLTSGGRVNNMPSWSWAATTGPAGVAPSSGLDIEWEVDAPECAPSTANPYGPVDPDSSIAIRGFLVPVTIQQGKWPIIDFISWGDFPPPSELNLTVSRSDSKFEGSNQVWLDNDISLCEWQGVEGEFYVIIGATQKNSRVPLALILKRTVAHRSVASRISLRGPKHSESEVSDKMREGEPSGRTNPGPSVLGQEARVWSSRPGSHKRMKIASTGDSHETCEIGTTSPRRKINERAHYDTVVVSGDAIEAPERPGSSITESYGSNRQQCTSQNRLKSAHVHGECSRVSYDAQRPSAESETFIRIGFCDLDNWADHPWREHSSRSSIILL